MINQADIDLVVNTLVPEEFRPIGGFDPSKVRPPQITNFSVLDIDAFLAKFVKYRPDYDFLRDGDIVMPRSYIINWGVLMKHGRMADWRSHSHSHSVWFCETISSIEQLEWITLHEVGHAHYKNNRALVKQQGWTDDKEELYADTYAHQILSDHYGADEANRRGELHGAIGGWEKANAKQA